jgi:hypothetical protein
MPHPTRREFLKNTTTAAAAGTLVVPAVFAQSPAAPQAARRTVMAIIGTSGRGTQLGSTFASLPGVVVKYTADVDDGAATAAAKAIGR